jgi:hypothetical protein
LPSLPSWKLAFFALSEPYEFLGHKTRRLESTEALGLCYLGFCRKNQRFESRHLKPTVKKLALPEAVDFRSFRTMHSGLMSSIGVRPEVTRDNMGHATVDVTQNVYNRTWWEERVEAVSMAAATVWREFLLGCLRYAASTPDLWTKKISHRVFIEDRRKIGRI